MDTWTWRYLAADGSELAVPAQVVEQPSAGFPSQADAETWVGEAWRQLLGAGVEQVTLLYDGERVYGPMSLRPPQ